MAKIKICGLSRYEDIEIVNEVLPDYIGFVFADSRRKVSDPVASELRKRLNPGIKVVGVFVNEDILHITELCKQGIIDIVQLHGDEDEGYLESLRSKIDNEIIKAVRVRSAEDILKTSELECDYLLFDAFHKEQYGGSGKTFDWTVVTRPGKPYFLAGGLNQDNILQAVKLLQPYAVDISSGVETDGFKDADKIRNIIAKVRSVE